MSTLDFLYGSHFGFGHVGGDHKDDSDGSERERPRPSRPRRQGLVLGDLVPPTQTVHDELRDNDHTGFVAFRRHISHGSDPAFQAI